MQAPAAPPPTLHLIDATGYLFRAYHAIGPMKSPNGSPTNAVFGLVQTVLKHARTGQVGDGKLFVLPVEEAYRIRTGESGEETLQLHPDAATMG